MIDDRFSDIHKSLTALQAHAMASHHRYIVVLQGTLEWGTCICEHYLQEHNTGRTLFVSEKQIKNILCVEQKKIDALLGKEFDFIMYDACSGFFPDNICIAEGLLKGGGLFFLIVPPFDKWATSNDIFHAHYSMYPYSEKDMLPFFVNRLMDLIEKNETVSIITQAGKTKFFLQGQDKKEYVHEEINTYASKSQQAAVEEIIHVALGHRNRPLVMLANRGHGKSAALGIACAILIKKHELKKIIVTGPRKSATDVLFNHASQSLQLTSEQSHGLIEYNNATIEFIAPDALIQSHQFCNLLVIDEAAAIPSPLLETLLLSYHRIVFSTTVYGYEGNGRGFELKFMRKIKERMPGSRVVRIEGPVRWNAGDPLETFFYDAFLLNAEACVHDSESLSVNNLDFVKIDSDELIKDDYLLKSLYGLFHGAHYKTTPNDLRMMLDSPYISIYAYLFENNIIASVLLSSEGGLYKDIAQEIFEGSRRIKGHHLPQTLIQEFGDKDGAVLKYARVLRIAVSAEMQCKGIGSALLDKLEQEVQTQYDMIGAVYGCESGLLDFWNGNGYALVKLGHKKNAYSGYHSAVVLKAVSDTIKSRLQTYRHINYEKLLYAFTDSLRNLNYILVKQILSQYNDLIKVTLSAYDRDTIKSFVDTHRQLDVCAPSIFRLYLICVKSGSLGKLEHADLELLTRRSVQRNSEKEILDTTDFHGKNELIEQMRKTVGVLLESIN